MPRLTLQEKAALVAGGGFWGTRAIARAGIRSIALSDGPHGMRKQDNGGDNLGIGVSLPSTCFPPATGIASSWNPDLLERVGAAIGQECLAENVGVLLGPGVNIKRSPLCGRNFEYFSEDPLVSGVLGAAWVRGLQAQGVGASVKHFVANNQETNRMTVSAEVDERTLREIYLPAFEHIVKTEQPWTVMSSYNRVNGEYVGESAWLLTRILRDEWGFDGLVVSDWGAVDDRVAGLAAGMDLEMPGPQPSGEQQIVAAVESGALAEADLDASVERVLRLVERAPKQWHEWMPAPEQLAHHELAREAAVESIVLLRNEGSVLPFDPSESVAVIGEFARTPRIQGAGSSQVTPTRVDSALEELSARTSVRFAAGYALGRVPASRATSLRDEAVELAAAGGPVLVFVGLTEAEESEGFDRTHLNLPQAQRELIAAVAAVNPRVVVVLTNGGVVSLEPWHDSVAGILETWLLGQGGGSAIADVVLGVANPSARLAESIPLQLSHTPSFLNFPGDGNLVRYGEGVFVGYRYFESVEVPVRYPFGFGLSYTTFAHSGLEVTPDGRVVTVTVTNTGSRAGGDVVQVYVSAPPGAVRTPARELRAFRKVWLGAGQSATVTIELSERAYSYFDVDAGGWIVSGGQYEVQVAESAHDVVAVAVVNLVSTAPARLLGIDSALAEWLAHPLAGPLLRLAAGGRGGDPTEGGASVLEMVGSMPMRRLLRFPNVPLSEAQLRVFLAIATNPFVERIARFFARHTARRRENYRAKRLADGT